MNHTDEQQNCMLQTCCRNKTNYICPQKQKSIKAVENRFLLGIHNGLHVHRRFQFRLEMSHKKFLFLAGSEKFI